MNTRICKMIALTGCWLLAVGTACAQDTKLVSGTVTDAATGSPLAGVIVEAYGDRKFTAMTDDKGAYELKVPEYVSSISLRVDGYQLQQKAIGRQTDRTDAQLYPSTFTPTYEATTVSSASRRAENFVFPTCNYMQENTKVSITLTDVVSKGDLQKKTHTKKLFLDCIYLRPKGMVKPEE